MKKLLSSMFYKMISIVVVVRVKVARFWADVGQIGPQMGQIPDFFRSDWKHFDFSRICPILGQSDSLWVKIWSHTGSLDLVNHLYLVWSIPITFESAPAPGFHEFPETKVSHCSGYSPVTRQGLQK